MMIPMIIILRIPSYPLNARRVCKVPAAPMIMAVESQLSKMASELNSTLMAGKAMLRQETYSW